MLAGLALPPSAEAGEVAVAQPLVGAVALPGGQTPLSLWLLAVAAGAALALPSWPAQGAAGAEAALSPQPEALPPSKALLLATRLP